MNSKILECPDNPIMQEDMDWIAKSFPYRNELSGRSVFITGATGLIGSQTVKALAAINRIYGSNITILPFVRDRDKARRVFGKLLEREDICLLSGDLNSVMPSGSVDYIIHTAAPTNSKYFIEYPVETIQTILSGTQHILDLACRKSITGMVFLSSLEVYGTPDTGQEWLTETNFGKLDPANVRSSYSEGKRMAECMCTAYAAEYHIPVCMARLSQTFGPGVDYRDDRVFMDFARHVIEGSDIILHTEGKTVRTYLYTADAVLAILYLLVKGEKGDAYNITNRDTAISIREMAELVCKKFGNGKSSVRTDTMGDAAAYGYNPEMVIRIDPSKLEALGWRPSVGLSDMFQRLIHSAGARTS